jgi:3-oxoacyl-[acyl-carrier protein] reductase
MGEFNGQVVIVTASAGAGIGQETARRFAREGANVVVSDAHAKRPFSVAEEITEQSKVKAIGVQCDVTNDKQIRDMVDKAIAEWGKIDILVNNAGTDRMSRGWEISDEDWEFVLNVTLSGAFRCIRAVFPHLVKQKKGKIVNISSVSAWAAEPIDSPMYIAAKAGVLGLTRAYAHYGAPYNINVNAIAPGLIPNPFLRKVARQEDLNKMRADQLFQDRDGTPADIANAVMFLASAKAGFITGETITVNGGFYLRG